MAHATHVDKPLQKNRDSTSRSPSKEAGALNFYVVAGVAALGGLLFGYDTGVISGAELFLVKAFALTSFTEEVAVSAVLVGAIVGAMTAGKLADRFGRRIMLMVLAAIFGIGAVLTSLAPDLPLFVVFRIIVGYGVGGASVVAPMYTSELAPPDKRGSMVFLFQLAVTVGIAVAYWVDLGFSHAGMGWRPMFFVAVIPAAILLLGMIPLTDTPRWLAGKGRWDEASTILHRFTGESGDSQIDEIRDALKDEKSVRLGEFFRGKLRLPLTVGLGLAILQQFVGINTIIYYAPTIFGYAGFKSVNTAILATSAVGVLNVLATIVAVFLVDRVGRRILLISGLCGMCLALFLTGLLFAIGPKSAGILLLACLLFYIASFAIGMGPVFWLLSQEVFPTRARGLGAGISAMGNWSANLVVSLSFLSLIAFLGRPLTFWIYAVFAALALIFTFALVPETKGKSLEEIQASWGATEQAG